MVDNGLENGQNGKTDEKKRGVRIGGRVQRRKTGSEALGQVRFRRARAHGQQGGAADTHEQRSEKHGNATQQRKAAGGTKDLAGGNGCNGSAGGLDEGQ